MNRQVRQNFETQAVETSGRIERLYQNFREQLTALQPTDNIPQWITDSREFMDELWRVRNLREYVTIIERFGPEFALNAAQARNIANLMNMSRKKADGLVKVAQQLENSLDRLLDDNMQN